MRRRLPPLVALLVVLLPVVASGQQLLRAQQRQASLALREGDSLRDAHRCEEAIRVWRTTFRQTGHWVFVMRIGQCFEILGRYREATEYLQMGRELAWDDLNDQWRTELLEAIARVESQMPALLEITADIGDARVRVDGEQEATLPLRQPISVEPGHHIVEVSAPGYRGQHREFDLGAGSRTFTSFTLLADQTDLSPSLGRTRRLLNRRRLWSILYLGVGFILAGVGAWLAALDDRDAVLQTHNTLGPGVSLAVLGGGLVAGGLALLIRPPGTR